MRMKVHFSSESARAESERIRFIPNGLIYGFDYLFLFFGYHKSVTAFLDIWGINCHSSPSHFDV